MPRMSKVLFLLLTGFITVGLIGAGFEVAAKDKKKEDKKEDKKDDKKDPKDKKEEKIEKKEPFKPDQAAQESLTIGDLAIDVAGHAVTRNGQSINLTPLEFDLLVCLARKPWQVFTREVLLEQVWGYRHAADTRLVNVHVQRLRSKVERDPEHPEVVLTVRGVGYKAGPP